jgi:hypothetical protein
VRASWCSISARSSRNGDWRRTSISPIRGAIPREVLRAVTRATYLQLWWPQINEPVYVDALP